LTANICLPFISPQSFIKLQSSPIREPFITNALQETLSHVNGWWGMAWHQRAFNWEGRTTLCLQSTTSWKWQELNASRIIEQMCRGSLWLKRLTRRILKWL
jgi:hypothetical protein